MTSIERIGMSMDDFIRTYDEEGPFELLNGERVPLSPNLSPHGWPTRALFRALDQHCSANHLGEVFTEMTFVLLEKSNWVEGSRQPDVMFISAAQYAAYKANTVDREKKPMILIPEAVAEIISPTDRYSDVNLKVDLYLKDGVKLIWVIDPQRRAVMVYRAGSDKPEQLSIGDSLDGYDVIPGFTMPVADLFE